VARPVCITSVSDLKIYGACSKFSSIENDCKICNRVPAKSFGEQCVTLAVTLCSPQRPSTFQTHGTDDITAHLAGRVTIEIYSRRTSAQIVRRAPAILVMGGN
jgi:hypothetical protein